MSRNLPFSLYATKFSNRYKYATIKKSLIISGAISCMPLIVLYLPIKLNDCRTIISVSSNKSYFPKEWKRSKTTTDFANFSFTMAYNFNKYKLFYFNCWFLKIISLKDRWIKHISITHNQYNHWTYIYIHPQERMYIFQD